MFKCIAFNYYISILNNQTKIRTRFFNVEVGHATSELPQTVGNYVIVATGEQCQEITKYTIHE